MNQIYIYKYTFIYKYGVRDARGFAVYVKLHCHLRIKVLSRINVQGAF